MIQYGPGMTLPLSVASRFAGFQSRVNMRLGALRNIGAWQMNMSVQPGINLYVPSAVGQVSDAKSYEDPRLKTVNPANCILRENTDLANFACNGAPPNLYTIGSRATVFYNGIKTGASVGRSAPTTVGTCSTHPMTVTIPFGDPLTGWVQILTNSPPPAAGETTPCSPAVV